VPNPASSTGDASEIFIKKRQESNIFERDEYASHAKKILQYDRNYEPDEFGKIYMVRKVKVNRLIF
jgi:hypothetical protein